MEKNVKYCNNCKFFIMHYTLNKNGFQKLYYGHCSKQTPKIELKAVDDKCKNYEKNDLNMETKMEAFKDTLAQMSEKLAYLSELITQKSADE